MMTSTINRFIICCIKCQQIVKNPKRKFPRAQGDVFKFLVLSNQQSKTQRYSYYRRKRRKKENIYI